MKRLIICLLLAFPTVVGAHTVVYKDGRFLRMLRPGQSLRDYVVSRYAAECFRPAAGTALIERADSASAQEDLRADSVIYYDWRELAAQLDTVGVETTEAAREISKTVKPGDPVINRDSIITARGDTIRIRKR